MIQFISCCIVAAFLLSAAEGNGASVSAAGRHILIPDPLNATLTAIAFDFNGVSISAVVSSGDAVHSFSVGLTVACYFNETSLEWSNESHQPHRFAAYLNSQRLNQGAAIDTIGIPCNTLVYFPVSLPVPQPPPLQLTLVKMTEPNFNAGDANRSNYVLFHELIAFASTGARSLRAGELAGSSGPGSNETLRIEFIGDSITAGYCNMCRDFPANGTNSYAWEDFTRGWPMQVCASLGATCHYEAWSGRGMIRNCDDAFPTTMPEIIRRAVATVPSEESLWGVSNQWNTSRFEPQIVVVNLGANDFICNPILNKTEFEASYVKTYVTMAESLLNAYNHSGLMKGMFLACGPVTNSYCDSVLNVVSLLREKGSNVLFLNQTGLLTPEETCCGHPSAVTDEVMADFTTAMILEAIG